MSDEIMNNETEQTEAPETEMTTEVPEVNESAAEAAPEQTRHLRDEKKCAETALRFGTIAGKYVIYRGKTQDAEDIRYLNVEEYLLALGQRGSDSLPLSLGLSSSSEM